MAAAIEIGKRARAITEPGRTRTYQITAWTNLGLPVVLERGVPGEPRAYVATICNYYPREGVDRIAIAFTPNEPRERLYARVATLGTFPNPFGNVWIGSDSDSDRDSDSDSESIPTPNPPTACGAIQVPA